MKRTDWILVAFVSLVFACGVLNVKKAHSHDPITHTADSLADAKSDAYGLCCNGEDYVRITTWESSAEGYRIFYKGEWLEGSRRVKVNNMENPDGEAKAWIYHIGEKPYIRCFMPGQLS